MSLVIQYIALIFLIIAAIRYKLSFVQLILILLARVNVAMMFSWSALSTYVTNYYAVSSILFCVGLISISFIKQPLIGSKIVQLKYGSIPAKSNPGLIIAVMVVLILTTYHYTKIGIPILSDSYDMVRFNVAASGFFGIPSRMATYGPMLILMFTAAYLTSERVHRNTMYWILTLTGFMLLLQGHKSSLAQLAIALVIINRVCIDKFKKIWKVMLIVGIPIIVIYFYLSFGFLKSLSDFSFFEYLVARYTNITLQPIVAIINWGGHFNTITPSILLHDLMYPFLVASGHSVATINTQLSQFMYGVGEGGFSVPVTPTFIGYYHAAFGEYGAYLVTFLTGCCVAFLYNKTLSQSHFNLRGIFLFFEYIVYIGLASGNMFYLLPNALLVLCIFSFFRFVGDGHAKSLMRVKHT